MEHLSKQQLVLLAVLISFVTSLATGIVTVTLMDQAPVGVTKTITQVIQKTVATVPTGASTSAAVAIAVDDQIADATASVMPSLVRLRDNDQGKIVGIGLIVNRSGAIMTDKNLIDNINIPQAVFGNNNSVPISISRFQLEGSIVFLAPNGNVSTELQPITFGNRVRLGESVWSLSGTSTYELAQGIVTEIGGDAGGKVLTIHTSILSELLPGAPLFDATGSIIGIYTGANSKEKSRSFYPVAAAKEGVPK